MDDDAVIAAQIGRPTRAQGEVVARCHLGLPVVIKMPPFLDDGTPFPTRYWLTCPLAARRIGRIEAVGGVKSAERKAASEADFGARLAAANAAYAADRDGGIDVDVEPRPTGGVGGVVGDGVKCLHAHYAHHAAGGDNPVGEMTAGEIEPLDCEMVCVADGGLNPEWREPR